MAHKNIEIYKVKKAEDTFKAVVEDFKGGRLTIPKKKKKNNKKK